LSAPISYPSNTRIDNDTSCLRDSLLRMYDDGVLPQERVRNLYAAQSSQLIVNTPIINCARSVASLRRAYAAAISLDPPFSNGKKHIWRPADLHSFEVTCVN
jgi:hypothetical protein